MCLSGSRTIQRVCRIAPPVQLSRLSRASTLRRGEANPTFDAQSTIVVKPRPRLPITTFWTFVRDHTAFHSFGFPLCRTCSFLPIFVLISSTLAPANFSPICYISILANIDCFYMMFTMPTYFFIAHCGPFLLR